MPRKQAAAAEPRRCTERVHGANRRSETTRDGPPLKEPKRATRRQTWMSGKRANIRSDKVCGGSSEEVRFMAEATRTDAPAIRAGSMPALTADHAQRIDGQRRNPQAIVHEGGIPLATAVVDTRHDSFTARHCRLHAQPRRWSHQCFSTGDAHKKRSARTPATSSH